MTSDRATFLRAGGLALLAPGFLARSASASSAGAGGLTWRGVTYDTGTAYERHDPTRQLFGEALVRGELRTIAEDLHCSSVAVFGSDRARLLGAARTAAELGLHGVVQPRLIDVPQPQALDQLGRIAAAVEELRSRYQQVALNVGVEAALFVPGVVPGKTWRDRITTIT